MWPFGFNFLIPRWAIPWCCTDVKKGEAQRLRASAKSGGLVVSVFPTPEGDLELKGSGFSPVTEPQNQWPHDWHGCVIGKPDIPFGSDISYVA